jgi:FAD/FMN-containing dehydrogenase/Fe-S oxidoreductase
MSLQPDFTNELRKHFTGDLRLDRASRILYSTDASMYQIEPLGVAIPKTQDDLQSAVELAAKYKIPVLPRGSGSSLGGQAIGEALILDCSRWLDSIIQIDAEAKTATVEPGVVLNTLNAAAAKQGLMFGPDPASAERATMGGCIANNATGAHSILYGMTADHLLSADVLMADGTLGVLGERSTLDNALISNLYSSALEIREKYTDAITQNWPRTWRNSAGYRLNYLLPWSPNKPPQWTGDYPANLKPGTWNLAPLLAGSEGTLAIIQRATVRLVEKPKYTILAVLSYQSNADACDDVPRLLTHHPSAIELVPRLILRLARSVPAYASQMGWVVGDPAAVLVVEFSGDQPSALREEALKIGEVLTIAESKEDQARIWNVRKVGLGLLDSRPRAERPAAFIEDCAIPVEKLGQFVREVEGIMAEHNAIGGVYAHASAGCLHIRPVLDLHRGEGVRTMRRITEQVFAAASRVGGSMSSEHGDGIVSGEFIEKTYGEEVTEAMRRLKHAADPDYLLNPKKMFDAPPMDTQLRFGEGYHTQAWTPAMHFDHERGLAGAIEQCNGQGVCRKTTGTMCPSFQATREEMHSTRGRANLLRALISNNMSLRAGSEATDEAAPSFNGRLLRREDHSPRNDMTESVAHALDLCLACKGCKSECPSGVDMAKLKFEFQNRYYKTHRHPLRDYVFGYFHVTAALASFVAPLANAVMDVPLFKNIVAGILGITPKRPFPKFSNTKAKLSHVTLSGAKSLSSSDEILRRSTAQNDMPKIIFLSDAFARYVDPQVEQAAFDVLTLCGYDVQVLPMLGAGASLLSKGFVDAAKDYAGKVLDALKQLDPNGEAPVVGIEPPEIYCLKNDYFHLVPNRKEEIAQRVDKVWLLDEFLLRSEEFKGLRVGTLAQYTSLNNTLVGEEIAHLHLTQVQVSSVAPLPPRNDLSKLKFQPHCHQRAEGPAADGLPSGANATVEVLRLCGYDVEVLDTGCCGMAGTFGYEAEHYDVSMKVGELKLFPILKNLNRAGVTLASHASAGEDSNKGERFEVVSTGAACRMQIEQGTETNVSHPVVLIRDRLLQP